MSRDALLQEGLDAGYAKLVEELICFRFRILAIAAILLHLAFAAIDWHLYPSLAPFFFKIRIGLCSLIFLNFCGTFARILRRRVAWLMTAACLSSTGGVALMIYFADGAHSRYYEGINLAILALVVVNSFHVRYNFIAGAGSLLFYTFAVIAHPGPMPWNDYFFPMFFMGSTFLFVLLMTRFYGVQHKRQFMTAEELRRSQHKLNLLYRRAEEQSKRDDLTGIFNRRHFLEILDAKMELSRKTGAPFYVVIFDVDHFKEINDNYGHAAGDEVLREVAQAAARCLRVDSYIGRYGGDEFMFVFDRAEKAAFLSRIEEIRQTIGTLEFRSRLGEPFHVSASFGAVCVRSDKYPSVAAVVEAADTAMLEVKRANHRGEIRFVD